MRLQQDMDMHMQDFLRHSLERLRDILLRRDVEFTQVQTHILQFFWGLWLLNPLWDTFSTASAFATMALLAPEWVWGLLLIVITMLQIAGEMYGIYALRKHATFAAFLFWSLVAAVITQANYRTTGAVVYPVIALSVAWIYLRLIVREKKHGG